MNTNEFKQSIINLQETNKDKMNQTHKTFYKRYKSRTKTNDTISSNPCFSNTLYSQQKKLEATSKESNSPQKKFFGLDGKTPLNFNATARSIYNTQMKTVSNIQMKTITNHYVEEDIDNLNQIFSSLTKGKKYRDKDSKDYLYSKYKIDKALTESERKDISRLMRPVTSNNINDISFNVKNDQYLFPNPFKSSKAMKQNLQLAKTIDEMRNNKLCTLCYDKFGKIETIRSKTAKMPPIKVIPTQKQNEILESIKQKYQNIFYSTNNNQIFENNQKITREEMLSDIEINITYKESNYHPPSRTQFASVYAKGIGSNKLYVFGGLGGKKLNDLWECVLTHNKIVWSKVEIKGEMRPYPRFGHSMHLDDKNILYIIGGIAQQIANEVTIENEILVMFDLNKKKYISYNDKNCKVSFRRSHNSIMIGHIIMISGGIDINNNYLSDCWLFNTETRQWSPLDIKGRMPPPLGYHSSVLAFEKDRLIDANSPIYAKPQSFGMNLPDIKEEGVFFFGGMNDNRIPTNMLYVMKIGQKPVEFYIPTVYGQPPYPRISATMNFYSPLNMIIIHGGRNDTVTPSFYNDYYLIDLETMNWIRPKFADTDEISIDRAEHCSFINQTKLYIFGGVNISSFMNFDFEIVNLDFIQEKLVK